MENRRVFPVAQIFFSPGIQATSENGSMEPKYYTVIGGDLTHQSSSENMTVDAWGSLTPLDILVRFLLWSNLFFFS